MGTGVRRCLRRAGWALVAIGAGVLGGSLLTDMVTDAAHERSQHELRDRWTRDHHSRATVPTDSAEDPVMRRPDVERSRHRVPDALHPPAQSRAPADDSRAWSEGDPVGLLWFERAGEPVATEDELVVLSGVTDQVLARGPGRYPRSAPPGGLGNLAIAGHRTMHGAPFDGLDELHVGDVIHVIDAAGVEWAYRFRESRIVDPTDVWVVGVDPLDIGEATLTLTTCHPRRSARQRLVVFAVLDGPVERSSNTDTRRGVAGRGQLTRSVSRPAM